MQTTTAKLYSLEYNNARTYGFSALFIAGNILLQIGRASCRERV